MDNLLSHVDILKKTLQEATIAQPRYKQLNFILSAISNLVIFSFSLLAGTNNAGWTQFYFTPV